MFLKSSNSSAQRPSFLVPFAMTDLAWHIKAVITILEIMVIHHQKTSFLNFFFQPLRVQQTSEDTYVMFLGFHFSVFMFIL